MMTTTRNASAVREPNVDELESFRSPTDILTWAAVKGDPSVAYSQAGSLLYLLAGDEFKLTNLQRLLLLTSNIHWRLGCTAPTIQIMDMAPPVWTSSLRRWSRQERELLTVQPGFGNTSSGARKR